MLTFHFQSIMSPQLYPIAVSNIAILQCLIVTLLSYQLHILFENLLCLWKTQSKYVWKMFRLDQRWNLAGFLLLLSLSLSLSFIPPHHCTVLKMFRLDQKQLFTDYWRNLKPKQTFDPVPHYYPPSQWRPISGNGDKENRETLTSLCFHPVNSRLTFKNHIKRMNILQIPWQISLYDIFLHFGACDFWNAFGWLDSGKA